MGTQVKVRLSLLERSMISFPDEAKLDFILEEQTGVCFPGEGDASTSNHRKGEANFRQSETGEKWIGP